MAEADDVELGLHKGLRRAVVSLAILRTLEKESLHGYGIAQLLKPVLHGMVPEGTLYPLLNRFEKVGWIKAEWQTDGKGAARKCYQITESGRRVCENLRATWDGLSSDLDLKLQEVDQ